MFPTRQISQSKTGWPLEQKESHRDDSSHRHSFSCTSTTSWLCFFDMSPTLYMQMISPNGAHLNTQRLLLTKSRKLWTRYSSGQMTGVFRSLKWNTGHSFLSLHHQRNSRNKVRRQNTASSRDSHLSQGKAWHPALVEATHRGHGDKRHREACCPEEIVWNTLGCQIQDPKNCLNESSPTISGIWGQYQGDSRQNAHQ